MKRSIGVVMVVLLAGCRAQIQHGLEERDGRRRSLFDYFHGRSRLTTRPGWISNWPILPCTPLMWKRCSDKIRLSIGHQYFLCAFFDGWRANQKDGRTLINFSII